MDKTNEELTELVAVQVRVIAEQTETIERLRNTIAGMQSRTGGLLVEKAVQAAPAAAVVTVDTPKLDKTYYACDLSPETVVVILHDAKAHAAQAVAAKQAEIDRLMLENCPGEMSAEQMATWEASQRRVPEAAPQQHAQSAQEIECPKCIGSRVVGEVRGIRCTTCNGTGMVDDGEINHYPSGEPFMCGPVKCVKDCPDCRATGNAQAALSDEQLDEHINDVLRPSGTKIANYTMQKSRDDMRAAMRSVIASVSQQPAAAPAKHADDIAVDRFAMAMKHKLAVSRDKGRSGWNNELQCTMGALAKMLVEHVAKGDPVDIANFAMMLHQREAAAFEHHPCYGGDAVRVIRHAVEQVATPPTPPQEAAARDERATFESEERKHSSNLNRQEDGQYENPCTQSAWEGWSNRAALAAPAAQVAVPDTDVQQIVTEVNEACAKWPRFNSAHEGFAVLKEEVDELWDHVKINQKRRNLDEMKKEAKQVSAMALRFMRECCDEITGRK